jgi:hypothetical protein
MEVDAIGIKNIADLIRQSGLPYFHIYRSNSGQGATPIYENLDSKNVNSSAEKFIAWANTILQGNPANCTIYDIVLHNSDLNNISDSDINEEGKLKRARKNKMRFSFCLKENPNFGVIGTSPQIVERADYSNFIPRDEFDRKLNDAIEKIALKNKIAELEKELEEEEEEEEEEKQPAWIGALMPFLQNYLGGKNNNAQINNPAVINGVNKESVFSDEDLEKIDIAVDKMLQVDKDIISNLEKLAELSEKNPSQFLMLVNMLNNM